MRDVRDPRERRPRGPHEALWGGCGGQPCPLASARWRSRKPKIPTSNERRYDRVCLCQRKGYLLKLPSRISHPFHTQKERSPWFTQMSLSTHEHENSELRCEFSSRALYRFQVRAVVDCRSCQPPRTRRVASGKLQRASTRVLWAGPSSGEWCTEGRARNRRWSGGAGAPFGPITASAAASRSKCGVSCLIIHLLGLRSTVV